MNVWFSRLGFSLFQVSSWNYMTGHMFYKEFFSEISPYRGDILYGFSLIYIYEVYRLVHSQSTTTCYWSFIFSPSDRVKSYFSLLRVKSYFSLLGVKSYFSLLVTVLISIRLCRELFFSQVLGVLFLSPIVFVVCTIVL